MRPLPSPVVMTVSPEAFLPESQNGVMPLREDIGLGAFGLDFLKFLIRVRLAPAGVDGFDENFVFVHENHSFLRIVYHTCANACK